MNIETLNALGLNAKQIENMIVERAVEALLSENGVDEWGDESERPSDLSSRVSKLVKDRIDAKVNELADAHLMPKIDAHIDSLILQETTTWGEKRGKPMTVIEYLIARAEAYMVEPVDHNGNAKGGDSYNWRQHSTRIVHAIEKHLQYQIDTAMKESLKVANTTMAKGLHEACRVAINDVAAKFAIVAKGG